MGRLARLVAVLVAPLGIWLPPAQASEGPLVAAAADLQFALPEAADLFTKQTGKSVRLTFGSSGNFHRQIGQGAPFEMFLSADEEYALELAKVGKARDEGALYAIGRITLVVPEGSPLKADGSLKDLAAALSDGRLRKFAIANPDHAPYGRAARSALQTAGVWTALEPKLVLGENVAQAAQFATSGSAQGGIIAYSLALSPKLAEAGQFALIPSEWHPPLRQRMVLMNNASETAAAFYQFVGSPSGRGVLKKYGFVLPGEE